MTTTKATQLLLQAIKIRNHVLPLISERASLHRHQPVGEQGFVATALWSCARSGEPLPDHFSKDSGFTFLLVTPFSGANALPAANHAQVLAAQQIEIERPELGYCLDVFWRGEVPLGERAAQGRPATFVLKKSVSGKVLSLEWSEADRDEADRPRLMARLISIKPGPWEAEALALR